MYNHMVNIQPRKGQMLIFPSLLSHWVHPNQEDEERVTIAFNLRLASRNPQQGASDR